MRRIYRKPVGRYLSAIDRTVAKAVRRELRDAGITASDVTSSPQQPASVAAPADSGQVDGIREGPTGLEKITAASAAVHREIAAVWDESDDQYRQDQSHWRGVGRWEDERWQSIGQSTWARVGDLYHTLHRSYPDSPFPTLLEWGPGGGSNLYRFAASTSAMFGVDISAKNLDESGKVLNDFEDVRYIPLLLEGDPRSIVSDVTEPVDIFISTSVFQHFPSQTYGELVLEAARAVMRPGSVGYVQIRYDDGNPKYSQKRVEEYRDSHITATSYQLSRFWSMLQAAGFRPIKIANFNTSANLACFYFDVPLR